MKVELSKLPPRNEVKLDKQKGIYQNGKDNAYPQRVERIINSSVTAKTASNMLKKFIIGGGFEDESLNTIVVNSDLLGETTLLKLLSQIANSISKQNGAFIQVQWNANAQITAVKHIPYRDCRFGKTDSGGYSGKIHVYDNWAKENGAVKLEKIQVIDNFNPIKNVVEKQMETIGWRGQIASIKFEDEAIYPYSLIDAVLEDADTEAQVSSFKNGELRGGFNAQYFLYHTPFESSQDQIEFKSTIDKFLGGDHQGSIAMIPAEFDDDGKLVRSKSMELAKIERTFNADAFDAIEKTIANNIRKAFAAIPQILIEAPENSIFGTSGEAFVQAFDFYNTQTADYRTAISQWLVSIFKYSADVKLASSTFKIKPLTYGTLDTSGATTNSTAR
jgi:hypothetical protein